MVDALEDIKGRDIVVFNTERLSPIFERVVIAQPSLLVGDRAALGQPVRRAEQLGIRLLTPILGLVPASVRPIRAEVVARALVRALAEETGGLQRLPSAALQRLGARPT